MDGKLEASGSAADNGGLHPGSLGAPGAGSLQAMDPRKLRNIGRWISCLCMVTFDLEQGQVRLFTVLTKFVEQLGRTTAVASWLCIPSVQLLCVCF